ncbi:MAG: esterase [Oscillospiraceae bacterium]|nr:esterase [Oscillospiraceae bacterium]
MKTKRLAALLFAVTMITSALSLPQLPTNAADVRKFDLGGNAQSGWTSVSASTSYDKNKGYGFGGSGVKNVGASGQNERADAVQFTDWTTTFNVDLPKGLYRVRVTLGNTTRTSVYMENMIQIVNMTGNNAVDQILIPVTDGQLNVRAGAGKDGTAFSISALEIEKVSDDPTLPPTIWICGDSTVCNYYPLDTSTQGGWGQMLGHYVDNGWNIRNMAASGQWAKGFIDAGQFTPIETYGKPGDVYIISIGINDSKYYKGDEYQRIITNMTQRAQKKGMEVILVKQQGRNGDAQRDPLLTYRWYAKELDAVAQAEQVQCVDLFKLWQDYCVQIGADKTTQLYMNGDTLHPNRQGAEKLAELFATQFKASPVAQQPATEPPTEPPTEPANTLEEPADPEDFIYGDVNFDGVVDIFDMALVKKHLVQPLFGRNALRRADVDADGLVGVVDAVALQRYLSTGRYMPAYEQKLGFTYAIDQKINKGVHEDINAGFKETVYVNLDNEQGSSLDWTVFVPVDGNYLCSFGTANGSKNNRSMKIEVNGSQDFWMQDFLTTDAWTTWQERGIVLPLKTGKNTIRLTSATAEGGPNFDYLRIEWTDEPLAGTYIEK